MALTIDGSDPTGDLGDLLDAKLPIAGGKILQIVRATDTTVRSTTSTSYVDVTGMSVTITPQKSDSAVLIIASGSCSTAFSSGTVQLGQLAITDSSNNGVSGAGGIYYGTNDFSGGSGREWFTPFQLIGYSTPATTSATTYKLRFKVLVATTTAYVRNDEAAGQMYAIEVSA